ncbi:MAG: ABC transporter permease subunit [Desulfurococcaceae archaeon TW002]
MNTKNIVSILAFFLIWEFFARYLVPVPKTIFPTFTGVIWNFLDKSFLITLLSNYSQTMLRSLLGFTLGLLSGLLSGLAISFKHTVNDYISPIATLMFSVPSVAWVPILIVLVGIDEFRLPLAATFMCSYPPILYGVTNALRTFDRDQLDIASIYFLRHKTKYWFVILPQLMIRILPLVKIEAVMVWKTVFVAEMLVLPNGVGYLALLYASTLNMDKLIAVVLVLALTLILINTLMDYFEKSFSKIVGGLYERRFS